VVRDGFRSYLFSAITRAQRPAIFDLGMVLGVVIMDAKYAKAPPKAPSCLIVGERQYSGRPRARGTEADLHHDANLRDDNASLFVPVHQ
jgi:hypothetical protein